MRKIYYLLAILLFLAGCVTTPKPGMIWMYTEPLAKYERDPDTDFNKYKNFSVFPQAELNKDSKVNPIEEKQILFIARNYFESIGYNYIDDIRQADFIVGVDYSNEHKTQYIPPSSYTIPWYVPGQTQTTFINNYNTFSGNIGSRYFAGSGSGWGTATTTTPGYYVPMSFTRPGGYVGWYYPSFVVSVFDNNSKKIVWSGSVVGATSNADVRLSAQVLFSDLFGREKPNFPLHNKIDKIDDSGNGSYGIFALPFTSDGNNFYPSIRSVTVTSPAYKAGIRPSDLILKLDQQNTLNWPLSKILEGFNKNKGESLILTIQRDNKIFDVSIIAEEEQVARNKWKEIIILDERGNEKRINIPKL